MQSTVEDRQNNIKFHLIVLAAGFRTAKAGAATSINCAVNPEFNTQQCFYYADCKPSVSIPLSRLVWYELRSEDYSVSLIVPMACVTQVHIWHICLQLFDLLFSRSICTHLPLAQSGLFKLPLHFT